MSKTFACNSVFAGPCPTSNSPDDKTAANIPGTTNQASRAVRGTLREAVEIETADFVPKFSGFAIAPPPSDFSGTFDSGPE